MPHLHLDAAKLSHGDKLDAFTGKRGEHPTDRAERIVATPNPNAQGAAAQEPEEVFTAAPPRQISNYDKVRK